jgi:DNA-binding NarL/FixJ family response regulator
MSNSEVASRLHISEGTVKRHLTNIYAKLGVSSRADAAKKALMSGLITFRDLSEPNGR